MAKNNKFDKSMLRYVDWSVLVVIFILVAFSILSIVNATASPFTGDEDTPAEYLANLNLNNAMWQLIYFGVGLVAIFFIITQVDYPLLGRISNLLYVIMLVLLVAVRFFGSEQNGTTGWFMIGGHGFQPGEVCKILMIIVLAKAFADKTEGNDDGLTSLKDILPALLLVIPPFLLIASQPDLGTASVYIIVFLAMLFMGRANWKVALWLLLFVAIAVPVMLLTMRDYQRVRIEAFFNPSMQTSDATLQVDQAKLAIGSGQFFGKGLFAPGSLSQLNYVPEAHNDFIFAVTVEAFGFLGGAILIILYFILILRTFMLSLRARDDFGAYLIIGVTAMLAFHVIENIGMNIGIFPVTGIPLPFFSYGGSNMLMSCIAIGLVLCVDMRRQRWHGQFADPAEQPA